MIKKLLFLLFLLITRIQLFSQEIQIMSQDTKVAEVPQSKVTIHKKNNFFQLINREGEIILKDLDSAWYYENSDLFLVRKNGVWGMTSQYGRIIIPVAFDKIEIVYNWFWEVTQNRKKGIYNVYRGLVLPVEYDDIRFSMKVGKEFIVKKNGKTGIYNDKGTEITPVKYDAIENVAGALVLKTGTRTDYLIGNKITSDTLVLDKTFEMYGDYLSDIKTYYVINKNGRLGVIDNNCNTIIKPQYQDIQCRHIMKNNKNETCLIAEQNNLRGMIDIAENQIIPFQYEHIELIDSDFALVKINGYKHFYNFRTKTLSANFNFDTFFMFSDKYSRVKRDGKESMVDNKHGYNLVFPFIYDEMILYGEWFVVKQNFRYGVVDSANKVVIPIEYEELSISCNKVIARKNGKYGILSPDNKVLFPFEYAVIIGYSNKIAISQGNTTKTYDCNLKCIENCD